MANPAEPISGQICWPSPGSFTGHQRAHYVAARGQKQLAFDTAGTGPSRNLSACLVDDPHRGRKRDDPCGRMLTMPTAYGAEFRQDVIEVTRKGEVSLARIPRIRSR